MGGSQSIFSRGEHELLKSWAKSHNIVAKINYIISKTNSLSRRGIKKYDFRKECLHLVNFLIKQKNARPNILSEKRWEALLREYLSTYFNNPSIHGICPFILKEQERELLKLSYKAQDFCKEKNDRLKLLIPYKTENKNSYKCNNDPKCITNFKEYNAWIINTREGFFRNRIFKISQAIPQEIDFSRDELCDVFNDKTFHELVIEDLDKNVYIQDSYQGHEIITENVGERNSTIDSHTQEYKTAHEDESHSSDTSEQDPVPQSDTSEEQMLKIQPEDKYLEQNLLLQVLKQLETPQGTIKPLLEGIYLSLHGNISITYVSFFLIIFPVVILFFLFIKYASKMMFKQKKKIKRRHLKLMKIVTPSLADGKSKCLTHTHIEDPLYNDEKNAKSVILREHKMNKNIKTSKRKKDRTKTIIEIHMQVLEECRNEEWESNKGEFLKICLEVFTNEKYKIYPHLTNEELIMESTKRMNDAELQKLLWNKWVERHGNLLEKLKKEDWFINLKNEWKKEKAYIKKMEELKKKSSNENHNFSFLEREKDIWKQWIFKKGTIIEQYLEQELFKSSEEKLQNMLYKFEIEETINDVTLISIEELQYNKCYQEFYKYVKTKVLAKLCILVFMMVLEECKKERFIENSESYFDSSINEWKREANSTKVSEIIKSTTNVKGDISENKENTDHIEENFRKDIVHWISEEDKYINFIVNNEQVDKSS
ncbi:STP1 protein [Plasmodium malariae]|uniref:STP1 protein n=1 Tax=Plasmodium malariae TaxID=5858 RepID=A0A1D3JJ30_PLAMA|nr:STP1 protein [Plasmodium malariae]SBT86420.1 STP1 protein [Plasmodium malariae]